MFVRALFTQECTLVGLFPIPLVPAGGGGTCFGSLVVLLVASHEGNRFLDKRRTSATKRGDNTNIKKD